MQDADYQASLQADKQKELNSLKKAETHSSKEEESQKKIIERKVIHLLSFDFFVPPVSWAMKHFLSFLLNPNPWIIHVWSMLEVKVMWPLINS